MKRKLITRALMIIASIAILTAPVHGQQIPREFTKILSIGDSITEGISTSKSYRFRLTNQLDNTACNYEMVGSQTTNRDGSFVSKHEGYSGHGIEHFLNSLAQNPGIDSIINTEQPDVVLIHLGSNDMNRNQGVDATAVELQLLINRIWAIKSDIQIYVANVIPWFGSSNINPTIGADVNSLGPAFRTVVDNINSNQLHIVNVKNGYLPGFMINDGIHPNDLGDDFIANAFLARIHANNDCPTPPITLISSPLNDGDTLSSTHTFTGSAADTDGDGIQRVRLAIQDNSYTSSSDRWFNFSSGQFGPFSESTAVLSNASPTSVMWSKSVTLPPGGSYRIFALAVDSLGNQNYFNSGFWPTSTDFFTSSDSDKPTTTIATPAAGDTRSPGGLLLSGSASDTGGSGIDFVQIALRDRDTQQWYNFSNNSFSGAVGSGAVAANLFNTTTNSTDWRRIVTLGQGSYTLRVRTFDNENNVSDYSTRFFDVQIPDSTAPTTAITTPAVGDTRPSGGILLSGIASDIGGSGIDFVEIELRSRDTLEWYNFSNNSFTGTVGRGTIPAILSNTTTNSTDWRRIARNIDPGSYLLRVRAFDNENNVSTWRTRIFDVQ